jgi:hypothetical protein
MPFHIKTEGNLLNQFKNFKIAFEHLQVFSVQNNNKKSAALAQIEFFHKLKILGITTKKASFFAAIVSDEIPYSEAAKMVLHDDNREKKVPDNVKGRIIFDHHSGFKVKAEDIKKLIKEIIAKGGNDSYLWVKFTVMKVTADGKNNYNKFGICLTGMKNDLEIPGLKSSFCLNNNSHTSVQNYIDRNNEINIHEYSSSSDYGGIIHKTGTVQTWLGSSFGDIWIHPVYDSTPNHTTVIFSNDKDLRKNINSNPTFKAAFEAGATIVPLDDDDRYFDHGQSCCG